MSRERDQMSSKEQNQKDMTIGQSSTDRIAYLNQTRRDYSMNRKERKEKV